MKTDRVYASQKLNPPLKSSRSDLSRDRDYHRVLSKNNYDLLTHKSIDEKQSIFRTIHDSNDNVKRKLLNIQKRTDPYSSEKHSIYSTVNDAIREVDKNHLEVTLKLNNFIKQSARKEEHPIGNGSRFEDKLTQLKNYSQNYVPRSSYLQSSRIGNTGGAQGSSSFVSNPPTARQMTSTTETVFENKLKKVLKIVGVESPDILAQKDGLYIEMEVRNLLTALNSSRRYSPSKMGLSSAQIPDSESPSAPQISGSNLGREIKAKEQEIKELLAKLSTLELKDKESERNIKDLNHQVQNLESKAQLDKNSFERESKMNKSLHSQELQSKENRINELEANLSTTSNNLKILHQEMATQKQEWEENLRQLEFNNETLKKDIARKEKEELTRIQDSGKSLDNIKEEARAKENQLTQNLESLKLDIEFKSSEVLKLTSELDEALDKQRSSEKELLSAQRLASTLQTTLNDLESSRKTDSEVQTLQIQQISDLTAENSQLRNEISLRKAEWDESIQKSIEAAHALQEEFEKACREIDELRKEGAEKASELDIEKIQKEAAQREAENWKEQLEEEKKRAYQESDEIAERGRAELKVTEEKVRELDQELGTQKAQASIEKQELEIRVEALLTSQDGLEKKYQAVNSKLHDKEDEISRLNNRIREMAQEKDAGTTEQSQIIQSLEEIRTKYDTLEIKNKSLEREILEAQREASENLSKKHEIENHVSELKKEKINLEKDLEEANNKYARASTQIEDQKKKLNSEESNTQDFSRSLQEKENEVTNLKNQIQSLETKLNEQKEETIKLIDDKSQLEESLKSVNIDYDKVKTTLDEKTSLLSDSTSQQKELESELQKLSEEVKQALSQLEEKTIQLEKSTSQLEDLKAQLKESSSQLELKSTQLEKASQEVQSLQSQLKSSPEPEALPSSLASKEAALNLKEENLKTEEARLSEARTLIDDMQKDVWNQQMFIDEKNEKIANLEKTVEEAQAEIAQLKENQEKAEQISLPIPPREGSGEQFVGSGEKDPFSQLLGPEGWAKGGKSPLSRDSSDKKDTLPVPVMTLSFEMDDDNLDESINCNSETLEKASSSQKRASLTSKEAGVTLGKALQEIKKLQTDLKMQTRISTRAMEKETAAYDQLSEIRQQLESKEKELSKTLCDLSSIQNLLYTLGSQKKKIEVQLSEEKIASQEKIGALFQESSQKEAKLIKERDSLLQEKNKLEKNLKDLQDKQNKDSEILRQYQSSLKTQTQKIIQSESPVLEQKAKKSNVVVPPIKAAELKKTDSMDEWVMHSDEEDIPHERPSVASETKAVSQTERASNRKYKKDNFDEPQKSSRTEGNYERSSWKKDRIKSSTTSNKRGEGLSSSQQYDRSELTQSQKTDRSEKGRRGKNQRDKGRAAPEDEYYVAKSNPKKEPKEPKDKDKKQRPEVKSERPTVKDTAPNLLISEVFVTDEPEKANSSKKPGNKGSLLASENETRQSIPGLLVNLEDFGNQSDKSSDEWLEASVGKSKLEKKSKEDPSGTLEDARSSMSSSQFTQMTIKTGALGEPELLLGSARKEPLLSSPLPPGSASKADGESLQENRSSVLWSEILGDEPNWGDEEESQRDSAVVRDSVTDEASEKASEPEKKKKKKKKKKNKDDDIDIRMISSKFH